MSDDSDVIVISCEEFEEENEVISDDDHGSISHINAIEISPSPPPLKDQDYFELLEYHIIYIYIIYLFIFVNEIICVCVCIKRK